MLRYKVIVNPQADRGESIKSLPQVEELLKKNGIQYDLAITERPLHGVDLTQQAIADGYDVIIAAGGDGTANEVINGFMRARSNGKVKAAMGIIPIGRGNDFAYSMGAPTEVEAAIDAIKQDHRKSVDIGLVSGGLYPEGRYIGNGIGIGFDAVVGFVAARHKHLTGFISYLWAALKTIFLYYKAPQVKIELDNEEIVMDALMVSVMNGRRMGGGFMMAPDGVPDDGLMNLCIANQVSQIKCLILLPKFMNATQFSDKDIRGAQSRRVVVTALKGTLPVHGDGETIALDADRIVMELFPKQIDLIVSPE
jgi:diacylglycerol kinase (ATP)